MANDPLSPTSYESLLSQIAANVAMPGAEATDQQRDAVAELLEPQFDWERFMRLGYHLHFLPAAHRYFADLNMLGDLPPNVKAILDREYLLAQARYLKKLGELNELLDALATTSIEPIVVKGIALASQLYGDPGIRVSKDIDLLFAPDDIGAVETVVEGLGYRKYIGGRSPDDYRKYHYHYIYVRGEKIESVVEVHWNLLDPKKGHPIVTDAVRTQAKHIDVDGRSIMTLGDAHALWHSCVHLSYETFLEFRNLADLKRLASRLPPEQWPEMIEFARRQSTYNEMSAALAVAEIAFGGFVPNRYRDALRPTPLIAMFLIPTYTARGVVWEWAPIKNTHYLTTAFLLRRGAGAKLKFLYRLVFPTAAMLAEIGVVEPPAGRSRVRLFLARLRRASKVLGASLIVGPMVKFGLLGSSTLDPERHVELDYPTSLRHALAGAGESEPPPATTA